MKRAYLDIQVFREINVSSTGHYFGKVRYVHNGQRIMRDFDFDGNVVMAKNSMEPIKLPQYVMQRIRELYLEAFESGHNEYYEYDRDKNKRYNDLRYFSYEGVEHIIQGLRRDLGLPKTKTVAVVEFIS